MSGVCIECSKIFFYNTTNLFIISVSFALSLISLLLLRSKRYTLKSKQYFIYSHIFFLVMPIIYYIFFNGCSTLFTNCDKLRSIMIMIFISTFVTLLIGMVLTPIIFLKKIKKKIIQTSDNRTNTFLAEYSSKLNIKKPNLFILDDARPYAFSYLRSSIFISQGMKEILSWKELESVILHELYHIINGSSVYKFSTFLLRISPLAPLASSLRDLTLEEINADRLAVKIQKTKLHITSAKTKIRKYYSYL